MSPGLKPVSLQEAIKSRDDARQRVSELEGTAEGASKLQKELELEKAKSAKLQVVLKHATTFPTHNLQEFHRCI